MEKDNHQIEPLSQQESEEMWENVIGRIRVQEAKRKKKRTIYSIIATTAAILIVGSIAIFKFYPTQQTYQAKESELIIVLKDGSQVTLEKGAKLTVESSFSTNTRDVFLEGDAVFKVSKSKEYPFIVHGENYETKVLGTVFRVAQRGNDFHIDLFEGKVQVYKAGTKESFTLNPKETFSNMGSLKIATIKSSTVNNEDPKISTATLSVSNVPLSEAVNVIENTYRIKINYPTNRMNSIISVFKEKATGKELLQLIAIQLNLKIKTINDQTFELEN